MSSMLATQIEDIVSTYILHPLIKDKAWKLLDDSIMHYEHMYVED